MAYYLPLCFRQSCHAAEGTTNSNLYSMLEVFCCFTDTFELHDDRGLWVARDEQQLQPGNYYIVTNGMCLLSFNHQPLLTQYRFHLVPRSAWHNTYIHSSANCGTSLTSLYAAPGITNANLYSMVEIVCLISGTFDLHDGNGWGFAQKATDIVKEYITKFKQRFMAIRGNQHGDHYSDTDRCDQWESTAIVNEI